MFLLVDMNHCSTVVPSHFGEFTFLAWHSAQRVQRKQPKSQAVTDLRSLPDGRCF